MTPFQIVSKRQLAWVLFVLALVGSPLCLSPARAADTEPLPTGPELHKMFDAAQYTPLLAKLARVLQLKGDAGKAYDRVDLGTLKADTLLQQKQQTSAVGALNDAVKAITDQTDPKVAAQARATQTLLKRSAAFAYTPKNPPGAPISILDMTKRKAAYNALLADMTASVEAKAKAAKAGKTLPPIIEAVRGIADMRSVEIMAKDNDAESAKLADDLAAQAKTLMTDAMNTMSKRAEDIDIEANTVVTPPNRAPASGGGKGGKGTQGNAMDNSYKKGLTSATSGELKQIIDNSSKVEAVATDFQDVSKANAAAFKEIADAAAKVVKSATTTLNANYSKK